MPDSTGRTRRCRKVRSPSNTFAMYAPMGLVSASRTTKYKAICRIPFPVMAASEFLRPQQRVKQIHTERGGNHEGNDVFHEYSYSWSQPFTKAQPAAKNRT